MGEIDEKTGLALDAILRGVIKSVVRNRVPASMIGESSYDDRGFYGLAGFYAVWVYGSKVTVYDMRVYVTGGENSDGVIVTEQNVRSYGDKFYSDIEGFVRWCGDGANIGVIQTAEIGDIIYLYDNRPDATCVAFPDGSPIPKEDEGGWMEGGNFCYAINLEWEDMSEWGYATMFPLHGETDDERYSRQKEDYDALIEAFGGEGSIAIVDVPGTEIVGRSAV